MKKFIALLLVLALGLTLGACGNPKKLDPLENPLYHTLSEKMGVDFAEMDVYEIHSVETCVVVYMDNDQRLYDNCSVELGNGTTIQYPMTYGELCDAGWTLEEGELSDPFPAEETTEWFPMVNSDGKTIETRIYNSTESPMALRDVPVFQLLFGDEGTETFSVSGLQRGATAQEIMDIFGTPSSFYIVENFDGTLYMNLSYINYTNTHSLAFVMDPETGLLENLVFS